MTPSKINRPILCLFILSLCSLITEAQLTQHIRGVLIDQSLSRPVAGATVRLTGSDRSAISDSNLRTRNADRPKTFGINIKTIYAGGFRTTPIDVRQSAQQGTTVYLQKQAYTLQKPDYFRTDLRLSMKKDYRHLTTTLSLDVQNLTNNKNIYDQFYDTVKKSVVNIYQTGLIPVLNYKVEF
jgi:hypothetical protein